MSYNKEIILTALRKEIGEAIADNRTRQGLKQKELAVMCGISERTLISIENGYTNCSINKYLLISIALQADITDLFDMGVSKLFKEQSRSARMQARINTVLEDMQQRLWEYQKAAADVSSGSRHKQQSQDAETKAKYQPKGLARGGKCARIFMSMILDLLTLRNFAMTKG